MSTEADHLYQKNRKQREKMLMLIKNRTENIVNRPSPLTRPAPERINPVPPSFDLLKQYESNKSSQPSHGHSHSSSGQQFQPNPIDQNNTNKSFDYNSTLFKYLNQDSHSNILQTMVADKTSQLMFNNGSAVSGHSSINENTLQNIESNQLLKDNSLLNKIDELLNTRKKSTTPGKGIKNVYEEYLDKKSVRNSSGAFSNNSSLLNQHQSIPVSKPHTSSELMDKLKTIEEERATLTIDRSEADDKLSHKNKNRNREEPSTRTSKANSTNAKPKDSQLGLNKNSNTNPIPAMKRPPLAPTLASEDAIQRHKKKIQETMQQIRGNDFQEKDSIMFDISDISSDEESIAKQPKKDKLEQNKQDQDRDKKHTSLKQQKLKLLQELAAIQRELQQLEQEQQQQQQEQQ